MQNLVSVQQMGQDESKPRFIEKVNLELDLIGLFETLPDVEDPVDYVLEKQPFDEYDVYLLSDAEYNKIIGADSEMDKIGHVWDILFPNFQPRLFEEFGFQVFIWHNHKFFIHC